MFGNLKTVSISLLIIFMALFVLFYLLEAIIGFMDEKGSLPLVVLLFLIIAGALAIVVNITADMMA